MHIAISGASGLVGRELVARLTRDGHRVTRLVRREVRAPEEEISWNPAEGILDGAHLAGIDAVVHLGGDNIGEGRWTDAKKQRIRESRVQSTRLLAETMAAMETPPATFVCASAIGYYGERGTEPLTEESPPGDDFLADVCREWEVACQPARQQGVRVVNTRLGVVVSREGGALQKMLLPFKLGLGGRIGSGNQYWSWITLNDTVRAIEFILTDETLAGPVNAVAPRPVTNREFTKALGRALGRPTFLPIPAFAARLALGDAADALLLGSIRVLPERLEAAGFEFEDPELEPALRRMFGK